MSPPDSMALPDIMLSGRQSNSAYLSGRESLSSVHRNLLVLYFALQLVGGSGILLIILTVWWRQLKRTATWFALCTAILAYSVAYSLL
jgi:hypothetical protein